MSEASDAKEADKVDPQDDPTKNSQEVDPKVAAKAEGEEDPQGEGKDPAAKEPDPASKKSPHVEDWRDKRLAKLSQRTKDLTTELAKYQKQSPQAPSESSEDFEARVNAEADRRAALLAQNREFNAQSLAAQAAGEKAYGKEEFNRSIQAVAGLVDRNDRESISAHHQLIVAALETGEAPKIVHILGQDPNEAARIMGLSPVQMGIALARLASKDAPQTSKAPPPIEPVSARGTTRTEVGADDKERSDSLSTATFMARRNADIKAGKSRARL